MTGKGLLGGDGAIGGLSPNDKMAKDMKKEAAQTQEEQGKRMEALKKEVKKLK